MHNMLHRMDITHNLPEESAAILLDNCGFCLISVTLSSTPWANHLLFCRDLSGEGVFEIISDVLQSHDRKIVSAGYLSNQDQTVHLNYPGFLGAPHFVLTSNCSLLMNAGQISLYFFLIRTLTYWGHILFSKKEILF